jgi:Flp pilus assembly protein TadG
MRAIRRLRWKDLVIYTISDLARRMPRRLCADARGVSAIEFAIAAPFVLVTVLGACELAMTMLMDATVQLAAQAASRCGLTTTNPSAGTREQQAQDIANAYLARWTRLAGTTVSITMANYGAYANVNAANSASGMGRNGEVIAYNIKLTTPGMSGIPQLFGISQMTFQRSYLVQNE